MVNTFELKIFDQPEVMLIAGPQQAVCLSLVKRYYYVTFIK